MNLLYIIYILLLVLLTYSSFYMPTYMDKTYMGGLLILVLGIIISFFSIKEKHINLRNQLIKHSSLFLIGFLIVHFQYYVDFVLGNSTYTDFKIWYDSSIVVKSLTISIIGLLSFLIGYLSKIKLNSKSLRDKKENYSTILLQLLSFVSLIGFYLTVNPLYLMGHYGSVELSPEANYAQFAFQMFTFACIIQNSRNFANKFSKLSFKEYIKIQGIPFTIMIVIYLLSVMLSGDRGPLMSMSLAYLSGYLFLTKYKFKKIAFLLFIFGGATFITILGKVRLMDKNIPFTERVMQAYQGEGSASTIGETKSISPQTKELAASVRTLHMATAYVPTHHDYLYGRFQLQQILGTIPFGTEFKLLLFEDNSYKYTGSGQFITWIDQGDRRFYGLGTSIITDFYLDLNVFGVIIGMLFFGILIRNSELALYNNFTPGLFLHVLSVVYLAFSIYISRSTALFNMKLCVFIFIVLVINKYIINYKRSTR
ncbi:O-antigen polysaccharide polymerase Wzy family protein [Empedobacter falsenii]